MAHQQVHIDIEPYVTRVMSSCTMDTWVCDQAEGPFHQGQPADGC